MKKNSGEKSLLATINYLGLGFFSHNFRLEILAFKIFYPGNRMLYSMELAPSGI